MSKLVHLIGAGPGDIELMTVKSLRLIQNANIIIYDRLANHNILDEAPKDCKFINVGKTDGNHPVKQDEINQILYKVSLKYDNVIRLKGGDPFVFGRGGEEALYLKQRGIKFDIIPGITSAISVPAYAGIPVTHRGISSSFRVITGHEKKEKNKSSVDWSTFKANETLVFLMVYHKLSFITEQLLKIGKPKNYPVAVISKGTTKDQKVVVGTLDNIVQKTKGLETPVMMIAGEVVNLREKLQWFDKD